MTKIAVHSTAAELARGVTWADQFRNSSEIIENGGGIEGNPTYSKGIVLDGTNDYINYNNVADRFKSASISFVITFVPDFDFDENIVRYLFSSTSEDYRIFKLNNASNNQFQITLGNTLIANIPSATYSPAWRRGAENILVITSTTGDTSAWLNGTQILTNDGSAWTPVNVTEFYVGAASNGSGPFDGEITGIKVFNVQLTDQEALDISNQVTYNYMNQITANYPMTMAYHDPTNNQTLDASGNGYHMGWGTGSVPTRPTKNTTIPGYDFDGGDFMVLASGLGITDYPVTMSIWFRSQGTGITCFIDLADSGSSTRNMALILDINEQLQATVRNPSFASAGGFQADKGNWIHGVGVYHSATLRELYVNGQFYANDTTSVTFYTPNRFTIGRFGDLTPSGTIIADMAKAKVWVNKGLTPMQIADLYLRDLSKFSEV